MKPSKLYLLGKCDNSNPSSIPLAQIKQWEKEGLVTYLGEQSDIREFIKKVLVSFYQAIKKVFHVFCLKQ